MQSSGEVRLAIDCGSASTVAVVAWPDGRWTPLMFDGSPVLASAVWVPPDGPVVTGAQAWQAAAGDPDRFVVMPLRRGTAQVTVEGSDVEVADLVAATLRRVAGEAARAAGGPVGDVRLVVPAGWGPRRRTWLRQAAHRAGLGQPRLVEAPVTVAEQLLATGAQLPVGSYLTVCDVGEGFEVTVLRRGPAGFEVLSTLADSDAGGGSVDDALTGMLLPAEGDAAAGGAWWAATASIRTGKESLSEHAAVTVPMPAGPAVVMNGLLVEQAARPALERAAKLTVEAITAAEISVDQVAGLYIVGAAARMPATAKVFGEQVGVVAFVLPDPGLAAARGAADAGTETVGGPAVVMEPTVPAVRRAVAIAVPGLASLGLFAQFLLTAEENNALSVHYWVRANWGELAMAAVFALVACLSAGTVLGSLTTPRDAGPSEGPSAGPSAGRSVGAQIGTGIITAAVIGMTVAGMYAVTGSAYFTLPLGSFLRWTLIPLVPIVAVAALVALVAARRWRIPRNGWHEVLAFPTGSVVTAAAGMALVQYSLTTYRWPNVASWIDLAGRVGGFLLGVGVVMAVVSRWVLRLVLAGPLLAAVIVSGSAVGVLGAIYTMAVALWWVWQGWQLIARRAPGPAYA